MNTEASAVAQLAGELRRLQIRAGGPSLRRLAQTTHYSPSTLSRYFSGRQFPSLEVTRRLAGALEADDRSLDHLEGLWHEAAGQRTRSRAARSRGRGPGSTGRGRTSPDTIETPEDLAGALRNELEGRSVRQLAADTGLARTTVHEAVNGRRIPSVHTVTALARAAGLNPEPWIRAVDKVRHRAARTGRPSRPVRESAVPGQRTEGSQGRSPADVAALAARYEREGDPAKARQVLRDAARTHSSDAMADIAQALLALRAEAKGDALHEATWLRLHTHRFTAAVSQLGEEPAAIRLGGVYALAGLADGAPNRALRQTCIDVLCAYLRLPAVPVTDLPPGDTAARHTHLAAREVRHTIMRLIRDHLRLPAEHPHSWQRYDLDFTSATFDTGDFRGAVFGGGAVRFDNVCFSGGTFRFDGAVFSGGTVSFEGARFTGGTVSFDGAVFGGGTVGFDRAEFAGGTVDLSRARGAVPAGLPPGASPPAGLRLPDAWHERAS
ncbi:hypothetical protein GCM10010145_52180 [Streptomyces ruber]|uniref:HTH cro/C1-type domain-containing protein n=2 Tax=Streptomyces TaxID=1883 RepID=A0A918EWF5_9ACTN|nr:helix-turn-helix domain-containing protein [Streptomyces ruber]GGQ76000.1 hypothetical protein GCM10010145_52180 [Streptomyces ruber]